jgi:hypothetical protein
MAPIWAGKPGGGSPPDGPDHAHHAPDPVKHGLAAGFTLFGRSGGTGRGAVPRRLGEGRFSRAALVRGLRRAFPLPCWRWRGMRRVRGAPAGLLGGPLRAGLCRAQPPHDPVVQAWRTDRRPARLRALDGADRGGRYAGDRRADPGPAPPLPAEEAALQPVAPAGAGGVQSGGRRAGGRPPAGPRLAHAQPGRAGDQGAKAQCGRGLRGPAGGERTRERRGLHPDRRCPYDRRHAGGLRPRAAAGRGGGRAGADSGPCCQTRRSS